MEEMVKVQCILDTGYNDIELGEYIEKNRIYYTTPARAKILKEKNAVKILKEDYEEDEPRKRRRKSF